MQVNANQFWLRGRGLYLLTYKPLPLKATRIIYANCVHCRYDNISSLTKEMAQNVREELKAVKEDKQRLEGGLANVNRVIERVQTTSKQSKEKIKERFEKLRSCLSRRETKLLEELEEYISNHLETLESQKR